VALRWIAPILIDEGRRHMRKIAAAVVMVSAALGLIAGCAHGYVYAPLAIGAPAGPVVRYAVPPESPRGDVYVTSFGFTQVDTDSGRAVRALHARLAVANNGPGAWALDGRQQQLVAEGQPPASPAFINSDAGPGPLYLIPPGQSRVLDLYYFIPPPLDTVEALGKFSVSWRLLAGAEPISQTTVFARMEEREEPLAAYPPFVAVGLGSGVGWWFGPRYAGLGRPVTLGYFDSPARARATAGWRGTPSTRTAQAAPVAGDGRGGGR
jgi:hypothetical protein